MLGRDVMNAQTLLKFLVLSCVCALFLGVAHPGYAQNRTTPAQTGMPRETGNNESYRLGTGDKLKLTVFGQDDLGGEFTVDDQGFIRLPLIGQVKAAGLTLHDFEDAVTSKLADGYLRDPRVSVQVVNYRPFYIIGEVNKPGEYPYENGMIVGHGFRNLQRVIEFAPIVLIEYHRPLARIGDIGCAPVDMRFQLFGHE